MLRTLPGVGLCLLAGCFVDVQHSDPDFASAGDGGDDLGARSDGDPARDLDPTDAHRDAAPDRDGSDGPTPDAAPIAGPLGTSADNPATTCRDLFERRPDAEDGNYWLDPDGGGAFRARCESAPAPGGWTVLARYAFAAGPDPFPERDPHDGGAWSEPFGNPSRDASYELPVTRFLGAEPGQLGPHSAFSVRAGPQRVEGTAFEWAPLTRGQHHAYATFVVGEETLTLASACLEACCGTHAAGWDTLVVLGAFNGQSPELGAGAFNTPAYGWVDHHCDVDGHDTTPAWGMRHGEVDVAPGPRFGADLVFRYR